MHLKLLLEGLKSQVGHTVSKVFAKFAFTLAALTELHSQATLLQKNVEMTIEAVATVCICCVEVVNDT